MRQSVTVAACIVRARAGEAVDRRRYAPLLLGLYLAANVLFIWLQTAVGNWFTTGPLARLNLLLGLLMAGTALVEARGRLLRKRTILSAPFVSMVAILIIACLLALLGRGTGTGLYRYVTYTAILGTAALCITKPFDLELALALYLVGCLVSAGVGLYCWGSQTALYLVQGANVAEVGLRSSRLVGSNTDPCAALLPGQRNAPSAALALLAPDLMSGRVNGRHHRFGVEIGHDRGWRGPAGDDQTVGEGRDSHSSGLRTLPVGSVVASERLPSDL